MRLFRHIIQYSYKKENSLFFFVTGESNGAKFNYGNIFHFQKVYVRILWNLYSLHSQLRVVIPSVSTYFSSVAILFLGKGLGVSSTFIHFSNNRILLRRAKVSSKKSTLQSMLTSFFFKLNRVLLLNFGGDSLSFGLEVALAFKRFGISGTLNVFSWSFSSNGLLKF